MNLTPSIEQPNGFHNGRIWAVYDKMYRTTLILPEKFIVENADVARMPELRLVG